jgi:acyl dehydratase
MITIPNNLSFNEINIGDKFTFTKIFTFEDGLNFASISGNMNQLHINEKNDYAINSSFKDIIVYGMLTASLFSTLFGMYSPGKKSLCLYQTLEFRNPLYYGEEVVVIGEVIAKYNSINTLKYKTLIMKDKIIIISGEAKVKVLD